MVASSLFNDRSEKKLLSTFIEIFYLFIVHLINLTNFRIILLISFLEGKFKW